MEQVNREISELSHVATTFFSRNGANLIWWISRHFIKNILFFLVIILSSLWCIDSNSMSYPYKACYAIILWDLNQITVHQNSNWCLTSYPQIFFITVHPDFNMMSYPFGAMKLESVVLPLTNGIITKYNMIYSLSLSQQSK